MVAKDEKYRNAILNSDRQNARMESDRVLQQVIFSIMSDNMELFKQFNDNPSFKKRLADTVFNVTYENKQPAKYCNMKNLNFEVLIDESFATINTDVKLIPINKKTVLSLINDFEDSKWRYTKFKNFIWNNIVETALSNNEREKLVNQDHSRLVAAAKNLRLTDRE